jgi:hypothetical protein
MIEKEHEKRGRNNKKEHEKKGRNDEKEHEKTKILS